MVVGLGNMGAALVASFLGAGFHDCAWNRVKEKADILLQKGAFWSENVGAALSTVDYIVMFVSHCVSSVEPFWTWQELDKKVVIRLTKGAAPRRNHLRVS